VFTERYGRLNPLFMEWQQIISTTMQPATETYAEARLTTAQIIELLNQHCGEDVAAKNVSEYLYQSNFSTSFEDGKIVWLIKSVLAVPLR
jgi:hypothetical protein